MSASDLLNPSTGYPTYTLETRGKFIRGLVQNGETRASFGFRQIVVSPQGQVREVMTAKHGGRMSDRHTVQALNEGDYIVRHDYHQSVYTFYKFIKGAFNEIKENLMPEYVMKVKDALLGWLGHQGIEPSYLPAGYGWDGQFTASDKRKKALITEFFPGLSSADIDTLFSMAKITPRDKIPMDWTKAGALTGRFVKRTEYNQTNIWVYLEIDKTKMSLAQQQSFVLYKDVPITMGDQHAFAIPKDLIGKIKRMAVIYHCPFTYGGKAYGIKWDLFSTEAT